MVLSLSLLLVALTGFTLTSSDGVFLERLAIDPAYAQLGMSLSVVCVHIDATNGEWSVSINWNGILALSLSDHRNWCWVL
jgi:hypothetical protein